MNEVPFYRFHWTDEIVAHLAENDVTPEEFEAVVQNAWSEVTRSRSSGLPARIGITDEGRELFCVFRWIDENQMEIEPVTGYPIGD